MKRARVLLRRIGRKLFRQKDTPHSIAWGTALGCFVAMTPTVGFQMVIGLAMATIFRVNKYCAAAMAWISNPLTIPAILYFQYRLGVTMLPITEGDAAQKALDTISDAADQFSFLHLWESSGRVLGALSGLGGEVLGPLLLGSFITGVILAAVSYPIALNLVYAIRRSGDARAAEWRMERESGALDGDLDGNDNSEGALQRAPEIQPVADAPSEDSAESSTSAKGRTDPS
jgi:uncharacterized protein (DUF2062 family)